MADEPMDYMDCENNQLRDKRYRGLAIIAIFHEFVFNLGLKRINFVEKDRKLLEDGFRDMNYGVIVWDDVMSKIDFLRRLQYVSQHSIHDECETFALVIISHGRKIENGDEEIFAYDKPFSREDVYHHFKDKNCPKLKDKPKLFIFHACRGENFGTGVLASGKDTQKKPYPKLGIEKDYLVLCSTYEGNYAIGPGECGSYFVTCLRHAMREEAKKKENERRHILSLLTEVIKLTASKNFEFCPKLDPSKEGKIIKQQPVMMMALPQLYYLKDKREIPAEELNDLTAPVLSALIAESESVKEMAAADKQKNEQEHPQRS